MIIKAHEDVLYAENQSNITYFKEVMFMTVLFYCDIRPFSVRWKLQCVVRMNSGDVCQDRSSCIDFAV